MLGPTLVSWDRATPATPAIPAPSPKVSASTRAERTPMARAIARFWETARTSSPSAVRLRIASRATKTIREKIRMKSRL